MCPYQPLSLYQQCQRKVSEIIFNAYNAVRHLNYWRRKFLVSRVKHYILSKITGRLLDDLCNSIYYSFPGKGFIYLQIFFSDAFRNKSMFRLYEHEPLSLYQQCQRKLNEMILNACKAIKRQGYGYNCGGHCESTVSSVQHYLLSVIPGRILDDLCNSVYSRFSAKLTEYDVDLQILLSVYLHENMQKFSACKIELPSDDTFWIKTLLNLRKVIILDLKHACTDEILEAIGNNCSLLEEVNISSKFECRVKKFNSGPREVYKFFISNEGLKHLCRCKNLKKIKMDRELKTRDGTQLMSHDGIIELVRSLPKLQFLGYTDVGMIVDTLVHEMDELQLTRIDDFHPCSRHIYAYDKLCPNLQELVIFFHLENEALQSNPDDILKALMKSKLKISTLRLSHFILGKHFEDFLEVKGTFLTSLHLLCFESISSDEVITIGTLCPNLKKLHLKGLKSSFSRLKNHNLAKGPKMFSSLQSLTLAGRGWAPRLILPMCLENALELNHILLYNDSNVLFANADMILNEFIDTLYEIMEVNPLKNLNDFVSFSTFKATEINILVSCCSCIRHYHTKKQPSCDEWRFKLGAEKHRSMILVSDDKPFRVGF